MLLDINGEEVNAQATIYVQWHDQDDLNVKTNLICVNVEEMIDSIIEADEFGYLQYALTEAINKYINELGINNHELLPAETIDAICEELPNGD